MFKRKRISLTITMGLIVGLLIALIPNTASAENMRYIQLLELDTDFILDDSQNKEGYITIHANTEITENYKVIISKEKQRYIYDFIGREQSYPLQMGDGEYSVEVYKKLRKNSYIALYHWTTQVEIQDGEKVYLLSNALLNWNEDSLAAKQAEEIVSGLRKDQDKAKAIYQFIEGNMTYDIETAKTLKAGYVPELDSVLKDKSGICYDFASLYAAMLRSVGIPAKLVMGTTTNVKGYHAWNEVLLNGKWVVVDTSYDIQAKAQKAKHMMIKTNQYSKEKEF